ncbi:histidinol-phosphate transaminase [Nanoarchaeota archaeon]
MKPKKSVMEMEPYRPPIEGRDDFIRLDFNENLSGPTKKIMKLKLSPLYLSVYPEYEEFQKQLAKFFKVKKENIIPTNGADEGIKTIIETYVDKNDEVLILDPTFPMYKVYSQILGAKIKKVSYNNDFSFPLNKLLKSITKKTKLIAIANPNNPTGTLLDKKGIIKILNKSKNSVLLLDEAYADFSGVSCINLINKYPNLIITRSFSKVFGLAGLRLGVILAKKDNINYLKNVRSPYSVNSLAVKVASIALKDVKHNKTYVKEIKQNKTTIANFLRKKNVQVFEGDANFMLAKIKNQKKLYNFLKKKGILIRQVPVKGYIRITIGTKKQNNYLIKCLGDYLG